METKRNFIERRYRFRRISEVEIGPIFVDALFQIILKYFLKHSYIGARILCKFIISLYLLSFPQVNSACQAQSAQREE